MTPVSELGPLDVQLMRRDEIGERRSGLVVRTAFDGLADESFAVFERVMLGIKVGSQQSISFETAARLAASITTGVMAPVYAQINPDALGNDLRDLNVATAYGERLAKHSDNAQPGAVQHLVSGYPSHNFIIDQAEAETLFKNVSEPPNEIAALISELGGVVYAEQSPHLIERIDQTQKETRDDATAPREKDDGSGVASGRRNARKGNSRGKRAPRAPDEPRQETRIDGPEGN